MPDQEIVIRLDMDGFRATFNPDAWPPYSEYRTCEVDHDEHDQPLNLDAWEAIEREA